MLIVVDIKPLIDRSRGLIADFSSHFFSSLQPDWTPLATGIENENETKMWNSRKVGILGGGQLGRMLVESANRLNIQANVLDAAGSPAKQISAHDGHVTGSFKDPAAVRELAKGCDVVTAEIEHVDTHALEQIASEVRVEPSWQAIRTIQNKYTQKEHLAKYGIPMAEHRELGSNSPEELARIGEQLGYPLMLKSKTMAYDGRGNYSVFSKADIPDALEALKDRPLYAEKWADFKMVFH